MKLGRCPVCHAHLALDALVQDEAGRELLGLLAALDTDTGRGLVGYLTLFRPGKNDLSNVRAVKLAREVLALGEGHSPGVLAQAMAETTEAIRRKGPQTKPMANHNYLLDVLGTCAAKAAPVPVSPAEARPSRPPKPASATVKGVMKLQGMKR